MRNHTVATSVTNHLANLRTWLSTNELTLVGNLTVATSVTNLSPHLGPWLFTNKLTYEKLYSFDEYNKSFSCFAHLVIQKQSHDGEEAGDDLLVAADLTVW